MGKPTISVAMCTYNGERYLVEQLNSLLTQTVLPNELVICDDGSTDGTLEILENFQKNVLFEVIVHKNETSLGTTKNFEKAISACSGSIIFLCDQDDVWLPTKIEVLAGYLKQNPQVEMVFSDAKLVDEKLTELNQTQWQIVRLHQFQQQKWQDGRAINIMLGGNRVTGCTAAFRSELAEISLPFPTDIPEVIHDTWLAWVATVRQSIMPLDKALTLYRQHTAQQVGSKPRVLPPKVGFKERFLRPRIQKLAPIIKEREELQKLYLRLSGIEKNKGLEALKNKLDFLTMRSQLSPNRLMRFFPALWSFIKGDYRRFKDQEADWKAPFLAFVGDVLE
ncbi:MAG: glycosyltransferase family 2 protein [Spirosomaceae bacterium]|nr:glycosyltransferase family 2 protein [Spirosomataceae bacterium]